MNQICRFHVPAVMLVLLTACAAAPPIVRGAAASGPPSLVLDNVPGFTATSSLGPLRVEKVSATLWVIGPGELSVGRYVEAALREGMKARCDLMVDAEAFELIGASAVGGLPPGQQLFLPKDREHGLIAWRFACANGAEPIRIQRTNEDRDAWEHSLALQVRELRHGVCRPESPIGSHRRLTACYSGKTGRLVSGASPDYIRAAGAARIGGTDRLWTLWASAPPLGAR